jgi:adenylate cyclase
MTDRQAAVLFADVSDSTRLYEEVGDAAAVEAISRCLGAAGRATVGCGGRVVKTMGDELMGIFPTADAAAIAAAEMQGAIDVLPEVAGRRLGMRIGFQHGAVVQRGDDVFGDTVNIAARLVAQAQKGQILTSAGTAAVLGPVYRSMIRQLYSITVKGKADELALAELVWKRDAKVTVFGSVRSRTASGGLRLVYRGQELLRRRQNDGVALGRDPASGLVLIDEMASRNHCTIERRQDRFVLRDHSTNGTYVTHEGDAEVLLRREEVVLRKHGWIAFGQPRDSASDVAEFFCD